MTATSPGISTFVSGPDLALEESSVRCREITRRAARNFYHGLKLLPEPKRSRMYALYAYMRLLDDIADEDDGRSIAQRNDDLTAWRELTHEVLDGRPNDGDPGIWPAFGEMVHRHGIPRHLFDAAIAGQAQDLSSPTFETFDDLREYCYRVAGVVGVASVYVWGYQGGAETLELAVQRGIAFQLTNILRDLRSDAALGRTYLPAKELAAAGITPAQIRAGEGGPAFVEFIRMQVERAESYYRLSAPLDARIDRDSRPTLVAMTEIYHGLLKRIARNPERILHERVSLTLFDKLWIASRAKRNARRGRRPE